MADGFEIKCKKCGSTTVDVVGTSTNYGTQVRVKFKCLVPGCGNELEIPVVQCRISDFTSLNHKND